MKESMAEIAAGNKEGSEGIEETRGVMAMVPRRMFLRLNYPYMISNYFRLSIKGTWK